MLGESEAVGHAGDEVRDVPGVGAGAWFWRLLAPLGRGRGNVFGVSLEELSHDPLGIAHDVHDPGMAVDARKQKGAQRGKLALSGPRERVPPAWRAAYLVRALRLKRVESQRRLGNGVVH